MSAPAKNSRDTLDLRVWLGTVALIVVGIALSIWMGGCSKQAATFTPAPRAVDSVTAVKFDGALWVQADPEHRYAQPLSATHSMEPFFNEHSLVLCVRYAGQPLQNGAVVVFNRGDLPRVLHVIADQTADSVYMSGYNNSSSDGWFPKTAIEGIVVGQLYLP